MEHIIGKMEHNWSIIGKFWSTAENYYRPRPSPVCMSSHSCVNELLLHVHHGYHRYTVMAV